MHPFDEPGEWFRCALHAHTTNSDGDLAPELLVRHYEWAGYDVLAITDHWVRTDEPSTPGLLVIPSAELNAIAPAREDDAHVLALGLEADPVIPELEFAPLQEVVSWVLENGGVPVSRPHLLERPADRPVGGVRGPARDRGLEHRLRARARPRRCLAALGRGARARPVLLRARDRRLAPPRLRQRLRLDVGSRPGEDAGRGARRAAHGLVLRLDRAAHRRGRGDRRRRHRALQPRGERHALHGPPPRRPRQRGPARLSAQRDACSSARTTA